MSAIEFNTLIATYPPAAYYRFSTGALTTDTGAGGHTLTDISDPAEDASGVFAGAVALDGNDGYSVVDHADFQPTGAFTVGVWVKTSTTANYQYIFQSFSLDPNFAGIRMYVNITNGVLIFQSGKNTGTVLNTDYKSISGAVSLADGAWHFAVGTWDGAFLRLYADGVQATTPVAWANAPAYAVTNYVRVGLNKYSAAADRFFFTGSLDDMWLLNGVALTYGQIINLYNGRNFGRVGSVYTTSVKKLGGLEIASVKKAAGLT